MKGIQPTYAGALNPDSLATRSADLFIGIWSDDD